MTNPKNGFQKKIFEDIIWIVILFSADGHYGELFNINALLQPVIVLILHSQ